MSVEDKILESLRWKPDMKIVNYEGEFVWLKEFFTPEGVRFGITDCCYVSYPCDWHKAFERVIQ